MATKFSRKKILLLGSGELGREVAIEAQRLGQIVIACDRYEGAPAMSLAHASYVFPMLDGKELRRVVELEKPDLIVPEIEAIATDELLKLESEGYAVIPTARAARLTMDREGIRKLAAEELKLLTSTYRFASSYEELEPMAQALGFPCVIKPTMSSSGHGQSLVKKASELKKAWKFATNDGRANTGRVIVEGFVKFDYEITLLTIRHAKGVSFCAPIGHRQESGDYRESWQPHPMKPAALKEAQRMAKKIVENLCGKKGRGIFGVEFFVKGNTVYFSELSPRPHDTGMVTLVSQNMSEMELHVRAILELPIPEITCTPAASAAILAYGDLDNPTYSGVSEALKTPGTHIRIFGKPIVRGHRRMGIALATGKNTKDALKKAITSARKVRVSK